MKNQQSLGSMKNQQSLVLLNSSKLKTVLEFKLQGLQKLGHTEKEKFKEKVPCLWIC